MNAREFHNTPVGAKVAANLGNWPHIAKVLEKSTAGPCKFLLRFHPASGGITKLWRRATHATRVEQTRPMGPVCHTTEATEATEK